MLSQIVVGLFMFKELGIDIWFDLNPMSIITTCDIMSENITDFCYVILGICSFLIIFRHITDHCGVAVFLEGNRKVGFDMKFIVSLFISLILLV